MQSKVDVLLEIKGITKKFQDYVCLDDINLIIFKGEILFICGYSGSGKTSLLEIICKYEQEYKGELILNGKNITKESIYYCNFKYLPKEPILFTYMSLKENIWLGFRDDCSADLKRKEEVIKKTMSLLNIEDILEKKIDEISYSEKYLICFSRAMIQNSPIIVMDEPFNNLDHISKRILINAIKQYNKLGVTFIIATTLLDEAKILSSRIAVLEYKKIRDCKTYNKLMTDSESLYAAEIFVQMYHINSNLIEIEDENIVVGNINASTVTIPKAMIQHLNIYNLAEKKVKFFIHYKNIYYKITNQKYEEIKSTKYNINNMYFVCKNIKTLTNNNILKLVLCGNKDFSFNLVVSEKVEINTVIFISFKLINLLLVIKK